jgi:hypothetical protein
MRVRLCRSATDSVRIMLLSAAESRGGWPSFWRQVSVSRHSLSSAALENGLPGLLSVQNSVSSRLQRSMDMCDQLHGPCPLYSKASWSASVGEQKYPFLWDIETCHSACRHFRHCCFETNYVQMDGTVLYYASLIFTTTTIRSCNWNLGQQEGLGLSCEVAAAGLVVRLMYCQIVFQSGNI